MAIFETTSYAQMRRCRMAHLYGEMIDERFSAETDGIFVGGYVHAIRPDLTCWPLRWSITVEAQPVPSRVMATSDRPATRFATTDLATTELATAEMALAV